VLLLRPAPVK